MKKVLALLLAAGLTISSVSCAAEAPQLLNFIDESIDFTTDFRGETITFGLRSFGEGDLIIPDITTNTLEADERRVQIKETETALNCIFDQKIQENSEAIIGAIASQSTDIDIYYGASYDHFLWCRAGMLHDFRENDVIDISDEEKWGTARRRKVLTYKGFVYGILPQTPVGIDDSTGIILVNDSMIKSFGQPTPKELLEDGNWTFDYFKNYVESVSDMNDTLPVYGMTVARDQLHILPLTAVFANGSAVLNLSDNGEYEFILGKDPKALTALNWARDVYQTEVIANDNYNDTFSGFFSNEMSSMYLGTSGVGTANLDGFPLRELSEGFSFICFPYGPDAEYGVTNSTFYVASMDYAIPISSDPHDMGLILDKFCENRYSPEELEEKKQNFIEQYFHFPEDYEFVYNISTTSEYVHFLTDLHDVHGDIQETLESIVKGDRGTVESIEKIKTKVEAELQEQN